jgi:hypothetical protein
MTADTQPHVDPEDRFEIHALVARWTAWRRRAGERLLADYQERVGQFADALVRSARGINLPSRPATHDGGQDGPPLPAAARPEPRWQSGWSALVTELDQA